MASPRVLLLVPSGTYRAGPFLDALERVGATTVVASERPQAVAPLMGDRFLAVDLADPERVADAVAAAASRRPVDAVVPVDDQATVAAAVVAARLGLRTSPPDAVRRTRDKSLQRRTLARAGVAQPRFAVVRGPDARSLAIAAANACEALGPPVVVKACTLSGSRGVIRADGPAAAAAAAERVRRILDDAGAPATEPLLVESYVPGDEVALEGLLRDGRLSVLAVFDKPEPLVGPFFEETLYVTPSRHPPETLAALVRETAAACRALGLSEGPVHAELRVPATGAAAVLEVAARTIGGRCGSALRFSGGWTLEDLVVSRALGRDPDELPSLEGAAGAAMLPIPHSGLLVAVDGLEAARAVPGVVSVEVTATLGRPIRALPEGDRYLGFAIARGAAPAEVETALRAAVAAVTPRIEPLRPGATAASCAAWPEAG
jgi:biotin carboxylase